MKETSDIQQEISKYPLLKAVYDYSINVTIASEWKRRGLDKRDPEGYALYAETPLNESIQYIRMELEKTVLNRVLGREKEA